MLISRADWDWSFHDSYFFDLLFWAAVVSFIGCITWRLCSTKTNQRWRNENKRKNITFCAWWWVHLFSLFFTWNAFCCHSSRQWLHEFYIRQYREQESDCKLTNGLLVKDVSCQTFLHENTNKTSFLEREGILPSCSTYSEQWSSFAVCSRLYQCKTKQLNRQTDSQINRQTINQTERQTNSTGTDFNSNRETNTQIYNVQTKQRFSWHRGADQASTAYRSNQVSNPTAW